MEASSSVQCAVVNVGLESQGLELYSSLPRGDAVLASPDGARAPVVRESLTTVLYATIFERNGVGPAK